MNPARMKAIEKLKQGVDTLRDALETIKNEEEAEVEGMTIVSQEDEETVVDLNNAFSNLDSASEALEELLQR